MTKFSPEEQLKFFTRMLQIAPQSNEFAPLRFIYFVSAHRLALDLQKTSVKIIKPPGAL